jgi:Ca-activated chloride channel family protein
MEAPAMTFAAPPWFWGFAIFPFLIARAAASERRRAELLQKVVATRLAPRLAGTVSVAKRRLRFTFLLLSLAFVLVTMARPQWGFTWEQARRKGRDVLIAIDTSRSMLADDLKPSRLGRAKLAAQDLIGELRGDRVGIIAFAGTAFLQAPLTIDYGAVLNSLKELDTEVIPQGGSNLAGAIKAAMDAFGKGESENRALIIFSDGEELDANAEQVIADLKGQVRIFAVGLGTSEGALIPIRGRDGGTEFVKDDSGNVVRTKLDETRLRAIAEPTGGFYVHLQTGRPEMQQIVQDGLGKMTEHDIDAKLSRRPIERYQWPLAAALLALVAAMFTGERRRGNALRPAPLAALLTALLSLPLTSSAKNEGLEAYERKDYTGARQQFTKQLERRPDLPALEFNLGSSAYKAGDYDAALGAFGRALTAKDPQLRTKAAYNLGNTLFQRGAAQQEKKAKLAEWKNALQHYDEALKADPQNEDAIYNRDVVRKLIEELEKEPPKQDDQQQKQQDKDKDKDKDQQKKDKQDQQQQQSGDQKKDDQQQQSGGGKDQDQQKKDDSQQPPPKDGNEQGKDQKDQKDASNQDQKQEQSDKGKEEKPDQRDGKDSQKKQDQQGDGQPKDEQGDMPPAQPEQKKEGELKSAPQDGAGEQQTPEEQAAAEAQAAAEGKMTPQQARALLESLKGEDKRVQLLDPRERKTQRRVLRDW